MASIPGARDPEAPASPRSDTASGHDTDTPGHVRRADKRKFLHTTAAQRQCLLEWLELPGNFELLTKPVSAQLNDPLTSSSTSSPRLKRLKKMDGYRSMALYMNQVAHTEWSEKTARSRFESFMAAYRKAKRQSPNDLPSFYRRVDALFGPDRGQLETTFGPTSDVKTTKEEQLGDVPDQLMATSESTATTVTTTSTNITTLNGLSDESTSSPLRKRVRSSGEVDTVGITATSMIMSSPLQERARYSGGDQALQVESQRLALKQQELELKQQELRARQEESQQKLRAEVLTKLVEAGKSPAEVREYLALMDPVDRPTPIRH